MITTKKIIIIILFIIFKILSSMCQNDSTGIETGKTGDSDKSVAYYRSLLSKGYHSDVLYFNMGNAYLAKKDYPNAVLYYEKALKISPYDSEIKHNLSYVRRQIDSEIVEIPDFFLRRWWKSFVMLFSVNIWANISVFSAILSIIFLWYKWFRNALVSNILLWIFLMVFSISVSAAASNYWLNFKQIKGILMMKENIFSAPEQRSERLYELLGGEKLRVIDSLDNWYHVELINKKKGWVLKDKIEKI